MSAQPSPVATHAGPVATHAGPNGAVLVASHVSVEYGGEVPTRAVRDVSIELYRGEMLGIAGESGCGKSTLAYALTRLLRPPAVMTEGQVLFYGRDGAGPVDIMALEPEALRRFRWTVVSMVFQSAMNSLNPVTSLRRQFSDIFEAHVPGMDRDAQDHKSRELLEMVGIDPSRLNGFPHELSGGMRQRVGIAMALALQPEIVIMDEPTTALDVVVQREILLEIARLRRELGFSVIFITHDLPMLVDLSDRLAVMYAGEIVERAPPSGWEDGRPIPTRSVCKPPAPTSWVNAGRSRGSRAPRPTCAKTYRAAPSPLAARTRSRRAPLSIPSYRLSPRPSPFPRRPTPRRPTPDDPWPRPSRALRPRWRPAARPATARGRRGSTTGRWPATSTTGRSTRPGPPTN